MTRAVPPPDRRTALAIVALALAVGVVLAAAHLCTGCAAPQASCPFGTYPKHALENQEADASGSARVDVVTRSGSAVGAWKGKGSADWTCARVCPAGTAAKLSEARDSRTLECHPLPCAERQLKRLERVDGGA